MDPIDQPQHIVAFSFKDFFSKPNINEPELPLDDPRWAQLEGGYRGSICNASIPLKQLEAAKTLIESGPIYSKLWDMLHHQGDVSVASYYAVPHLVRIVKENGLIDYNVFGLVTIIEIQRHKGNPAIPKLLLPAYSKTIRELGELAKDAMELDWDTGMASCVLAAIALSKGQIKLAHDVQELDDDDRINEYLEQF